MLITLRHLIVRWGPGGEIISFEIVQKYVTPELAYVVEVERLEGKFGGGEDVAPFDLRVTMIFRPEEGT